MGDYNNLFNQVSRVQSQANGILIWTIIAVILAIVGGILVYFLFVKNKTKFSKKVETLREICWDVLCEILTNWDLISYDSRRTNNNRSKVLARISPMSLSFPNGSKIIFKGMLGGKFYDLCIIWRKRRKDKYEYFFKANNRIENSKPSCI